MSKCLPREAQVFHHAPADHLLLDDPFGILGRHAAVPGAFGIDHADRAVDADPQIGAARAVPEHLAQNPSGRLITIGLADDSFVTLDLLLVTGVRKPLPKVRRKRSARGRS